MEILSNAFSTVGNVATEAMQGDIGGMAGAAVNGATDMLSDLASSVPVLGPLLGGAIDAAGGTLSGMAQAGGNVLEQLSPFPGG